MALLDISRVTRTLVKLVDESFKVSPAWAGPFPTVTPLSPDRLDGEQVLGIYLYHLIEDPAFKNQVFPQRPRAPIRFLPMGLDLHYIVSAHSTLENELAAYREQLMMGIALKALHDNPRIDESTRVNGVAVLDPGLVGDDNRIVVEMRQVPVSEAITYWTALGERPLRLSSFYQAQVILLEPEQPPTGVGRVLVPSINTFTGGLPHIDTSRNTIVFTVPGETTPRSIRAQPAQASPGDIPGAEISFLGTGFEGDAVALDVRSLDWPAPAEADPSWGVAAGTDRVFATARTTIAGRAVIPGPYTAAVRVTKQVALNDRIQIVEQRSNETPFMIAPGVTNITAPTASGELTVTGSTFVDPSLDAAAVLGFIGGVGLVRGTAGSLAPGEMAITSATTIDMRLPAGLPGGSFVPLKILVNGAESPPRWVQVP
jgi:hypothetical protein